MDVEVREVGSAVVVSPRGEIDMAHAPILRRALLAQTDQKSNPIVVNLAATSYIDSAGIATLVECLRSVMSYSGSLRLCLASELVKDVFEIANLDGVFSFFHSEEAALAD